MLYKKPATMSCVKILFLTYIQRKVHDYKIYL